MLVPKCAGFSETNNFTKRANDKDAWCTFAEKKRNSFPPFQIWSTVEKFKWDSISFGTTQSRRVFQLRLSDAHYEL